MHTHGRYSNNAIRDSLMILEGRVCGLSLIFPLSLLIPQSLLQRKRLSRAEKEQNRQRERVRKKNCQCPLKTKKKRDEREWSLQAKKSNCFFSPGCTCRGGNGQLTAHCSHSCPSSLGWTTGLNLATVRQIVFQPETNTVCLSGVSVQLLDTSINPAPPPHLPPPITDREVVSDQGCQSNFKAFSTSDKRGKKMSVSQGKNGAKQRSPVRALLVQHQTACLCLSVGTWSRWTTISFDVAVSSGLASTSDFMAMMDRGCRSIFGDKTGLGGSKDQGLLYVCLHLRGKAAAADTKQWQLWGTIWPGHCI